MKPTWWPTAGVLVPVLALGCSQHIDLPTVAPKAAEAVRAAFPDSTLTDASREHEPNLEAYEATLMKSDLRTQVLVAADGTIMEVETQVTLADVPAPAAEAIKKAVGDGKIDMIERVELRATADKGKLTPLNPPQVFYEFKYRKWGLMNERTVSAEGGPVTDA